jgi:aerotaxis receptor
MNIRKDISADRAVGQEALAPLYTRVNAAGIVRAVSPSVVRQLGISAVDLIGAPLRVMQVCDQPQVLTDVITEALAAGEPAVAYQKIRMAEGRDVWMVVFHLPTEDGLLQLRIPALAETFSGVPELYAKLNADTGSRASQLLVLQRGFAAYGGYSVHAIGQELPARADALGKPRNQRAHVMHRVSDALDNALKEKIELMRSFNALQLIPNNMRIVASRLEPAGGPISAIAENYKASSAAISQRLASFISAPDSLCEQLRAQIMRMLIQMAARRLLLDVRSTNFTPVAGQEAESPAQDQRWQEECTMMIATADRIGRESRSAMAGAEEFAARFGRASADIRRHMLGLDTIRVLGRVECSRLHESEGLSATIDQLDAFHSEIRTRLEAIIRYAEVVSEAMGEIPGTDQRTATRPRNMAFHAVRT